MNLPTGISIGGATLTFWQDADTCRGGDECDALELEYVTVDTEEGFWRIKTECWAVDDMKDLSWLSEVQAEFEGLCKHTPAS